MRIHKQLIRHPQNKYTRNSQKNKRFLIPAQLKKLAKEQKMIIRERKITAESVVQATLLASVTR